MRHRHAAIILAGGRAERLGGTAKAGLRVGGRTLLDRVMAAVPSAAPSVIVGAAEHPAAVTIVEDPPRSGPAYAVMTGLSEVPVSVPLVAVLAVDLPFLSMETVEALLDAAASAPDGAVLVDTDGHPQWLCGVWRCAALRRVGAGVGTSMRRLLGGLNAATVTAPRSAAPPWFDCDTPEALAVARRLAGSDGHEPAAVDVERDPRDVPGVGRREEQDGRDDLGHTR